ncbi:MAG: hypothetical protein GY946_08715 [bacterium]|nr:hypothetical protein [bacterium]
MSNSISPNPGHSDFPLFNPPIQIFKFGGDTMISPESRAQVARIIKAAAKRGPSIAIVSAIRGETEKYRALIAEASPFGGPESDAAISASDLAGAAVMANHLRNAGVQPELIYPWNVIETTDAVGNADITRINIDPITMALALRRVPVVAGSSGATTDARITTLGPDGSDYTAVAFAAALPDAEVTLFKGKVDGVYDKDPIQNADAQRFEFLTHDQALNLASQGAKVLNHKAMRLAHARGITVHVRGLSHPEAGTLIAMAPAA